MTHHHHGADAAHDHAHPHGEDDATLVELLDLDGEVLRSYWTDAIGWVREQATQGGRVADRVLDLGAGTGNGAITLAQQLPTAEVVAVDTAAPMLERLRAKASELGVAARVRTVEADLDVTWPELEPVELTWASMSLHHLADPDRVLAHVLATTRPGGLLAVAELSEQVRFLPEDLGIGRPGLEARCIELLPAETTRSLPALGSDWPARITAAGFTLVGERTFTIELDPPHPPAVARYAQLWLRRLAVGLADRLAPDDAAALAALVDGDGPESLRQRDDLRLRGTRTVTLARRL